LPEFIRQVRMCLWYTSLVSPGFLFSDWKFHGHPHFFVAIAARIVIEVMSLAGLVALAKADSFRRFQFVCVAWALPLIPSCAVLMTPHTDVALVVTFILPAFFYLAIPVSFRWVLVFGMGSSVASLAAYLSSAPFSTTSIGLALSMLLCNAILLLVLTQTNRLRRLEWAAIREGRAANEELSEHRDMLQKIVKAIPTPLLIVAKDGGRLIQANDAACDYFGSDLLGNPPEIESYFDRRDWNKLTLRLRADSQVTGFEARLSFPDGSEKHVLLEATTVAVDGVEAILAVFVDITQRKEVETMMKRLANTDPLSRLPNRSRFFSAAVEEIKRAERYKRPIAVFMVDIDFFKRINDTYGHEAGDQALKTFAELCRTWVRHQDIVARLGGEEFGFLLPETKTSCALVLANRLRAAVEGLHIDRLPKPMTISIGVAEVQHGETTVDAALSRADQALYAAKKAGRNRAILYDAAEFAPVSAGPCQE
jgi:diguanylate cyclase (GGDEF)-like protein/PAS domain S-box-containing protein